MSFEIITRCELLEQFILKLESCQGSMTFYWHGGAFFSSLQEDVNIFPDDINRREVRHEIASDFCEM